MATWVRERLHRKESSKQFLLFLVLLLGLAAAMTFPQGSAATLDDVQAGSLARANELLSQVTNLLMAGKCPEALPLADEALRIRAAHLEERDTRLLEAVDNLAGVYVCLGEYTNAERFYERALETRKKISSQHPNTATTLNDLGCLYLVMGSYAKALPRLEEALSIRQGVLGEVNTNTAATLNNLAVLYSMMGDPNRARAFSVRAAGVFEQLEVPEAGQVASSLDNLATLYMLSGNYTNAESLYGHALRVRERVSGREASETAVVLDNLGCLYRAEGKPTKALPLFERARPTT